MNAVNAFYTEYGKYPLAGTIDTTLRTEQALPNNAIYFTDSARTDCGVNVVPTYAQYPADRFHFATDVKTCGKPAIRNRDADRSTNCRPILCTIPWGTHNQIRGSTSTGDYAIGATYRLVRGQPPYTWQ